MINQAEAGMPTLEPQPAGIGGWLILPAIGFVLGSLFGLVSLIVGVSQFSQVAAAGYGGLYVVEILVHLGLWVFQLYAAMLFFGKKREAPATIIALLFTNVVASGLLLALEVSQGAGGFAVESVKQLARTGIGAAIWIPYFRVSKRVKATFMNASSPVADPSGQATQTEKTKCDLCGEVFPSHYYLEQAHGRGFLCAECRQLTSGNPVPG